MVKFGEDDDTLEVKPKKKFMHEVKTKKDAEEVAAKILKPEKVAEPEVEPLSAEWWKRKCGERDKRIEFLETVIGMQENLGELLTSADIRLLGFIAKRMKIKGYGNLRKPKLEKAIVEALR